MIINQTIRSGFVTVNKTGAYFSLISAGGVVNVRLSEKGRVVLDTKMWVGMSIDKAIPFDEITIQGDDGAVEFWAGDVSMYQARSTLTGAAAIRTSQNVFIGYAQLTKSDITRQSVRIRASKEITIGGAGVNGSGWRIPAGITEDVPVSGVLYGYRLPPELDMSQSQFVVTENDTVTHAANAEQALFSEDGSFKLSCKNSGRGVYQWTLEGGWVEHPYFAPLAPWDESAILRSVTESAVYVFRHDAYGRTAGYMYIYESKDDGRSFSKFLEIPWSALIGAGEADNAINGINVKSVGNIISWNQSGIAIGANTKSRNYRVVSSGSLGWGVSGIKSFAFINNDMTSALAIKRGGVGEFDRLFKSTDNLQNWVEPVGVPAGMDVKEFSVDYSGTHVALVCSDGYIRISNDGGDSFLTVASVTGMTQAPTYLANGVWIGFRGTSCQAYYISNGVAEYQTSGGTGGQSAAEQFPAVIMGDGTIYRRRGGYVNNSADKWQIKVTGDLSPVLVEIMELLS